MDAQIKRMDHSFFYYWLSQQQYTPSTRSGSSWLDQELDYTLWLMRTCDEAGIDIPSPPPLTETLLQIRRIDEYMEWLNDHYKLYNGPGIPGLVERQDKHSRARGWFVLGRILGTVKGCFDQVLGRASSAEGLTFR